ncbi:MAG: hypothetical protein ABIN56_07760, partial [Dokdonella sp.]
MQSPERCAPCRIELPEDTNMPCMRSLLHTCLIAGASMFAADAFAADWLQWGFEPSHSANNTVET